MPVARERLAARVGPQREPERQAPEEGLLAQELGHAVAHALRRLRMYPPGAFAGSTGTNKSDIIGRVADRIGLSKPVAEGD